MNGDVCGLNFIIFYFCILGIILEYKEGGSIKTKSIDLLDLTLECVNNWVVKKIAEPVTYLFKV